MPDFFHRGESVIGAEGFAVQTLALFRRLPGIARRLMYILPALSAAAYFGITLATILKPDSLEDQVPLMRVWSYAAAMFSPLTVFLWNYVVFGFVWFFAAYFCKVLDRKLASLEKH